MEESSDEDDFRPVVGKRRRKKASDDESVVGSGREEENLLNRNKFSQLAGSSSNKNNNNNNGNPAGSDGAPPVPAAKREPKQPPLVVKNTGFQDLVQVISSCSTKPFYKLTSAGIKLQCRTAGGFDNLRSHLQQNNVEFYTHAKRSERPHRVVIRGLPQYKPETVKQLLKKFQNLDALDVHAIRRKGESAAAVETPYIVVFPKGYTNLNKLRENNRLGAMIIRWEAYRNKRPNVTQCQNCLHLGHGTRNCHLKPRCNSCGGSHKSEECKPEETQAKRCANCSGAHEAMDRSCPKRADFIRSRQQYSKPKPPARKAKKRSPVPAFTPAEFPPLPSVVPDRPIPVLAGGSKGGTGAKASRVAKEAEAGGSQGSTGPRAGDTPKADGEEELFRSEELWSIFVEFSARLRNSRTRSDQVGVIGYMICKYGSK